MILAGEDAVDAYLWWVSPSLPGLHAETGLSQVQILPARPNGYAAKPELRRTLSRMVKNAVQFRFCTLLLIQEGL